MVEDSKDKPFHGNTLNYRPSPDTFGKLSLIVEKKEPLEDKKSKIRY